LHSHRSKLWAPGHRRALIETAHRHQILFDLLAARDGDGLARAIAELHQSRTGYLAMAQAIDLSLFKPRREARR
jgi:hypothetical protein